jgi:hypothetical protein
LFGIGYYGFSYVAGLSPIYGFNSVDAADGWKQYPDTIDPRQKDQTHTALMALNDVWKLGETRSFSSPAFSAPTTSRSIPTLGRADPAERVPHRDRRQRGL